MTDAPQEPSNTAPDSATDSNSLGDARPPLTWSKKLLFTAILLGMAVLGLELLGRLMGYPTGAMESFQKVRIRDQETFDRVPGLYQPGYEGTLLWPKELKYSVRINQLGFRGREVPLGGQDGVTRILCVGDSNTFCLYSNEDAAWPEVMYGLFEKDGHKTEMLNSGVPGWSTADQARYLDERALDRLKPDLVLHFFCGNDPYDIRDVKGQSGKYARLVKRVKRYGFWRAFQEGLRSKTALGELESRLELMMKAMARGPRHGTAFQGPETKVLPLPIPDDVYAKFESCYEWMAKACKARGVPLVTVCFPHCVEDAKDMPKLEQRVRQSSAKFGTRFLPLVEAFRRLPEQKTLYNLPHDAHCSETGNRALGEMLFKLFKAERLGPYKVR